MTGRDPIALARRYSAPNYDPLPVVIARAEGVWLWDTEGRRYLDCLSAYSALNQGHRHPRIIAALTEQAGRVTLTSRAVHNDRMGPFLERLCGIAGMDMALPMNTGAEAVETAIKAVRRHGYEVKGVAPDRAEIIVCNNNFHGRTTTITGFSSEEKYRRGFGPFGPGFRLVDFGDAAALEAAITPETVAFLTEPIQGEGGVIVPPEGWLRAVREICDRHDVLLAIDEIQTGLGRTGDMFCYRHEEGVHPDLLILGKALGGGVYPVSAVLASRDILGLIGPGEHGSTFGGNPLASAVGEASLAVIVDEDLPARSRQLGDRLLSGIRALRSNVVREVRGRGLFVGIEIHESAGSGRDFAEALLARGVLTRDTRRQVLRLAPPLVIGEAEIDWLLEQLAAVLGRGEGTEGP